MRERKLRKAPIPYVPVVDPVQDVVNTTKEHKMKIKLPDKTEIQIPIWHQGTPEAFLIHVCETLSTCKRKGYFSKYQEALDVIVKCNETIASTIAETAPATPVQGTSSKKPKKKKKTSDEAPVLDAGAEDAPFKTDTPGTIEKMMGIKPRKRRAKPRNKKTRLIPKNQVSVKV
jgi:hypothetical protein